MSAKSKKLFHVLVMGGCALGSNIGCDGTASSGEGQTPATTTDPATEGQEPTSTPDASGAGDAHRAVATTEAGAPNLDSAPPQAEDATAKDAAPGADVQDAVASDVAAIQCFCGIDPCCDDNGDGTQSVQPGFECCWGPC